jgi:hypothetical protein
MASEIKAGVLLSLKDQFSSGMTKAAGASAGFADKTLGALGKVDKALSGTAAKIGALGVTLSVGALVKATVDFDNRMVRLGTDIGASAEEVNKLRRAIYDAAQAPDIKLDASQLLAAAESMEGVDYNFIHDNLANMGRLMQATGISAEETASQFTTFYNLGASTQEITGALNDMAVAANIGGTSLGSVGSISKKISASTSAMGRDLDSFVEAVKAFEVAGKDMGAQKAEIAFDSLLSDLSDPKKQRVLKDAFNIDIIDENTGKITDFLGVIQQLVPVVENYKGDSLNFFSDGSLNFIKAFTAHPELVDRLKNLGDTSNALAEQSARNAETLSANFTGIQTAIKGFADKALTGPINDFATTLNKLAENPEAVENAIKGIGIALLTLTGIKLGAGLVSLIADFKSLKGMGNINVGASFGSIGSMPGSGGAMPVYVTNLGGLGSSGGFGTQGMGGTQGLPQGTLLDAAGRPIPKTIPPTTVPAAGASGMLSKLPLKTMGKWAKGGAVLGGITGGLEGAYEARKELLEIAANDELTGVERSKAKGGAVGNGVGKAVGGAVGGAAGMAAGAAIGAAIGSVVPGLGTAIGLVIGGAIGAAGINIGGKIGRKAGEKFAETAVTGIQAPDIPSVPEQYFEGVAKPEQYFEGSSGFGSEPVTVDTNIIIQDNRTKVSVSKQGRNYMSEFPLGSAFETRMTS